MSSSIPSRLPQGAADEAQRQNHRLPLRSGVFSPAQTAALELALATCLRRLSTGQLQLEPELKKSLARGGLLIRLMIDLGQDVEQLSTFANTWRQSESKSLSHSWGLVTWHEKWVRRRVWWLKPGARDNREMPHTEGVVFPFSPEMQAWFELAAIRLTPPIEQRIVFEVGDEPAPLFDSDPAELIENVASFIRWAKAMLGPRGALLNDLPSPATIKKEQMSWAPNGDRVLAERVSGIDSDDAKRFYTHFPFRSRKAYRRWVEEQDEAERQSVHAKESLIATAPDDDDKAIELSIFRQTLSDFNWSIDRRKDIVVEHRRITVLLWLVVSVAVASRARREPCPSPHAIDPRTGALLVLDKRTVKIKLSATDEFNRPPGEVLGDARIVFLSHKAQRLIADYHDHIRSLSNRKDLAPGTRKRCASLAQRLDEGLPIPLFELKRRHPRGVGSIKHALLGPTSIAQYTSDMLKLPFERNFARHMLRANLVGQVSHEVIDAQLGHWLQGVEPWSNGSALDPTMFRALMTAVQAAFLPVGEKAKDFG